MSGDSEFRSAKVIAHYFDTPQIFTWVRINEATKGLSDVHQEATGGRYCVGHLDLLDEDSPFMLPIIVRRLMPNHYTTSTKWRRERDILKDVQDQHIVRLLGFCRAPCCLVYEFTETTLHDKLEDMSFSKRLEALKAVGRAVLRLHSQADPVCHWGIRPTNILIKGRKAKLGGFEYASRKSEVNELTSDIDSPYKCPTDDDAAKEKNDIFSLGKLIGAVIGKGAAVRAPRRGARESLPVYAACTPRELRIIAHLERSCTATLPADRPHIVTVLDQLDRLGFQRGSI